MECLKKNVAILFKQIMTNSAAAKVNNCVLCGKSMKFAMMVGIRLINNLRPGPTLGLAYLGAEPHLHKKGGL